MQTPTASARLLVAAACSLGLAIVLTAPPALAVPLTGGGLLNSWETNDATDPDGLVTDGWYTPSWASYPDTSNWLSSKDAATDGTHSLKMTYTPTVGGNDFHWGARFESYNLGAYNDPKRLAWENPWREAIADNRDSYSLTFDVVWRRKADFGAGIPHPNESPDDWGMNNSVNVEWGYPIPDPANPGTNLNGYSGNIAFHGLRNIHLTVPQRINTIKIPLSSLISQADNTPIPSNLYWVQLTLAETGAWPGGEEAAVYFDNLRISQNGDANHDGLVNADDYAIIDRAFAKHVADPRWTDGDFNSDGTLTAADYTLIDTEFARTHPLSPEFLAARQAEFGPDYVANLLTSVPEPAALVPLAACLPVLRRRRHAR
jgi:hypothetical protein